MTDMKRWTVALPDDVVETLRQMKQDKEFEKCSFSELIRRLILKGLEQKED